MTQELKIGMIGLDTSHCAAFTKVLNDKEDPNYVPGGKVSVAFRGGSSDFELSYSRLDKVTDVLSDEYGVQILDTIEEVVEQSDAILLTSVDGRVHLEQFEKVAPYGKPVFIDKPFAVNTEHAKKMFDLAKQYKVPMMSASSVRYYDEFIKTIDDWKDAEIFGADMMGPMNLQETQPGLYWYGIHTVDALHRVLGEGCVEVTAVSTEDHEFVVGVWSDGRVGTIRGNRKGNKKFGALIHTDQGSSFADFSKSTKPGYASLMVEVMEMFRTGKATIKAEETVAIIRFIEAANESRSTGKTVKL